VPCRDKERKGEAREARKESLVRVEWMCHNSLDSQVNGVWSIFERFRVDSQGSLTGKAATLDGYDCR